MNSQKILTTLGPSSLNKKVINDLTNLNIDLFRLNMSHVKINELESIIELIRSFSKTPICIDTEGAQIRNDDAENNKVLYEKGDTVKILFEKTLATKNEISFSPKNIAQKFIIGDIINIDFNSVSMKVIEKHPRYFLAEILSSGMIGSNKAANLMRDIELNVFTDKDLLAFEIGIKNNIKDYSLSFTNTGNDVKKLRNIIGEKNIISKIESKKGVLNLKSIMQEADQILIDRGDLSREIKIEMIPLIQRKIISMANENNIPVFVATNLLESMVSSIQPNRAEVNDVISTLQMGANGLVLAAETAIGKYPVKSAEMIKLLINQFNEWDENTILDEI